MVNSLAVKTRLTLARRSTFLILNWNVTTSVDETALLAKLDLAAADTTGIPQGFLDAILGDSDEDDLQASTEAFEWGGGSETTYVLGGAVLGYAETHTYDDGAGGTSSNTSYYDSNHNHVGHSYEDSYGSGSNFRITLEVADIPTDDDDDPVVDAGGASRMLLWRVVRALGRVWMPGSEETSEYTHYYVAEIDGDAAIQQERLIGVQNSVSLRWSVTSIMA